MTDTTAESAEATRTPEEIAEEAVMESWFYGDRASAVGPIADAIRAALAVLNAQWREALQKYEGCAYWIAAEQHSCPKCAPLRALLSEGK